MSSMAGSDSEDEGPVDAPAARGAEAEAPQGGEAAPQAPQRQPQQQPQPQQQQQQQPQARSHVMVETDWSVQITAARAAVHTGDPLVSAPFSCYGTSFQLELTPNDKLHKGVSLRVRSLGPVHRVHLRSALAEIYIKKAANEPLERSKQRRWAPPSAVAADWDARVDMRDGTAVGWAPLIKQADLVAKERTHFISHDDTMCLHVEIYFYAESMLPKGTSLGLELSSLRRLEATCDACFVLRDGRELHAHLAVLCARSPYFKQVAYGENFSKKIASSGRYCAAEFEEGAFELFLNLLYIDDQRTLEGASAETVLEVLRIADLYCVDPVRNMCDSHLAYGATLTIETCGTLLGTAHRMGWRALKRSALEFFKRNKSRVLETAAFAKCLATSPDLAIEVLKAC
jgi:hypothetical protein